MHQQMLQVMHQQMLQVMDQQMLAKVLLKLNFISLPSPPSRGEPFAKKFSQAAQILRSSRKEKLT